MASSIPEARTSLVEALQTLTATGEALESVSVLRTGRWKGHQSRETIAVLNARNIDRTPALGGRQFVERFTIPVHVLALKAGDDLETVEIRLWDLVTVVEQTVLADASFGGLLVAARPAGSDDGEQSGPVDDRSVYAELTLNVECEARATLAA